MANEAIPFYEDADELPCYAKAAVTGKRLVQLAGDKKITGVGTGVNLGLDTGAAGGNYQVGLPSCSGAAGAGKTCLGVAAYDAAIGTVFTVNRVGIYPVTCAADVGVGVEVEVDVNGKIIPYSSGVKVGIAMTSGLNGADIELLLYQGGH